MKVAKLWMVLVTGILLITLIVPVSSYNIQIHPVSRPEGLSAYSSLSQLSSLQNQDLQSVLPERVNFSDRIVPTQTSTSGSIGSVRAYTDVISGDPAVNFHEMVSVTGQIFSFSYSSHWESGPVR